jgi:uncharacterized protein (TIGR02145 family)
MKRGCLLSIFFIYSLIMALTNCQHDDAGGTGNPMNGLTTAQFNPDKKYGTVADIDGNVYKTIKIGGQVWMAENLRVTHYQNGDSIPNIIDSDLWANQTGGAYCNYSNTVNPDTIATFGRLYNWYTTQDTRGLAPGGWRVANSVDWITLIEYLGGDTIASKHLKETGTLHWDDPNNADNSSGFTALPGGWRYRNKNFEKIIYYSDFWTSSLYSEASAPFLFLFTWNDNLVYKDFNYKVNGYSIRCIKE